MNKKAVGTILVLVVSTCICGPLHAGGHHHDNKAAHVHGAVKLEVAFDGNKTLMVVDGPAESFVGFEHEARTPKEKKVWQDMVEIFSSPLDKIVYFSAQAKCHLVNTEVKRESEEGSGGHDEHSDLTVEMNFECQTPLIGSTVEVALKEKFKHIQILEINVLKQDGKALVIKSEKKREKISL